MSPPQITIAALAVITCVSSGCADAGAVTPDWCVADGATVRLAAAPAGWEGALELTPIWRVDGDVPGRELLWPVGAAMQPGGSHIALSDFGLGEVAVISSDGDWIGRWGRKGSGPGELLLPAAVAWRDDGRLLVYDPANAKLVEFDSTGAAADDRPVAAAFGRALGGAANWTRLTGSGTLLAQPGPSFQEEAEDGLRTFAVVRGRDDGAVVDTLVSSRLPVAAAPDMAPIAAPGWQRPVAAMSGDSLYAVAGDRQEYRVRVMQDDTAAHVICRDVTPLPYDDVEATSSEENVPDFVTAALAAAPVAGTPASIGRLIYDASGRLWVERSRPRALSGLDMAAGVPGAVLDVYGADGAYLGEVRMPADTRFLGATDQLVVGLESSDLGVLSLVGYRPGW